MEISMEELASRELFLPVLVLVPAAVRVLSLQELVQEQELELELERDSAAVAFPRPSPVPAHSNAGRQTHLFFFSKIIPCVGIISRKSADYTDDTDNESLTCVICGLGAGLADFLSLTTPGLI